MVQARLLPQVLRGWTAALAAAAGSANATDGSATSLDAAVAADRLAVLATELCRRLAAVEVILVSGTFVDVARLVQAVARPEGSAWRQRYARCDPPR